MANPDPEITPEEARAIRADAIVATGRSDYPNQVNNVLGFPYIFRGALDVRASTINDAMKIAAAQAIAALAREDVPDEVTAAYRGRRLRYGPDYLIPTPFDPRLISAVPLAVAKAAMETGVARRPIVNLERYRQELRSRLDPTASRMQLIIERVQAHPKRIVFAEGEEEKSICAAIAWRNQGLGTPILIGREERVRADAAGHGHRPSRGDRDPQCPAVRAQPALRGVPLPPPAARGPAVPRLPAAGQPGPQRVRRLHGGARPCRRHDHRPDPHLPQLLEDVLRVIDPRPNSRVFGMTMMLAKGRTVFIADTTVHELPDTEHPGRHRHPGRAHGRAHGLHAARGAALVHQFRQPAGLQGGADPRRRDRAGPAPGRFRV